MQHNMYQEHGWCFLWEPDLIALHAISDAGIALAYASIPLTLLYLWRKHRVEAAAWPWIPRWLPALALGFAAFIVLCGGTHVIKVITIWEPWYWLEGYWAATTAVVSLSVAVALFFAAPKLLDLPATIRAQCGEQTDDVIARLAAVNERLAAENQELALEVETLTQLRGSGSGYDGAR